MHDKFIRLTLKNHDYIIDEFKMGKTDRMEQIMDAFITIVGVSAIRVLVFAEFLKQLGLKEETIPLFVSELKKQIRVCLKEGDFDRFLSLVRFIYILEYLNILDSGIGAVLEKLNENAQRIVLDCKGIERNKLMTKKAEDAFKAQLEIDLGEEFISNLNKYADEFSSSVAKISEELVSLGDVFIARYLAKNISFDKNECVIQMSEYFDEHNFHELIIGILLARELHSENQIFFRFLMVSLGRVKGFLSAFYKFSIEREKFDFLLSVLALIFETYYAVPPKNTLYQGHYYQPQLNEQEIEGFKSLIDEKLAIEMIKYSNVKNVKYFLPENFSDLIPEEKEFGEIELKKIAENNKMSKVEKMERKDFFVQFCKVSYPSISHFLIYLETFSSFFNLNEEEQKMFLDIFCEVNERRVTYLEHVGKKLLLFKVIDESVAKEYPVVFK